MRHDACLRAAARAIYDTCYSTEELAPVHFDEAEQYRTILHRRASRPLRTPAAIHCTMEARRPLCSRFQRLLQDCRRSHNRPTAATAASKLGISLSPANAMPPTNRAYSSA